MPIIIIIISIISIVIICNSQVRAVIILLQSLIICQFDLRLRVSPVWAAWVSNNDHLSLCGDTGMSVPWITFPWMNLLSFLLHFHVLTTSRLACISGIIASLKCQNQDWISWTGVQPRRLKLEHDWTYSTLRELKLNLKFYSLNVSQNKTPNVIFTVIYGFVMNH